MDKKVSILGATGSVGAQALSVVEARGYKVDMLAGGSNSRAMESAARRLHPRTVAMADATAAADLRCRLADTDIRVLSGREGILAAIDETDSHIVLNAILGAEGLIPTLRIIERGIPLALANKESLVVAGELVNASAVAHGVEIIPVDSEHSAIFQSIKCGRSSEVNKLLLTASGGPFYGQSADQLREVTLADTLAHPTWRMGSKITVDSATLMNKGFEIIEAAHLFGIPEDRVDVLIHRESILHSAVEFCDHTIVGEMSVPDMRACIQYALDYPARVCAAVEPLDLARVGSLTFARPDYASFPLLSLARQAYRDGGASGAVLNAADELAVSAFLRGKIAFWQIPEVVFAVYESLDGTGAHTIEDILEYDKLARTRAEEIIGNIQ